MAKLTLTPQQKAVVENHGGSLLVSAAAGSGKSYAGSHPFRKFMQGDGQNKEQHSIEMLVVQMFFSVESGDIVQMRRECIEQIQQQSAGKNAQDGQPNHSDGNLFKSGFHQT